MSLNLDKADGNLLMDIIYKAIQISFALLHWSAMQRVCEQRTADSEEVHVQYMQFIIRWYSPIAWVSLVLSLVLYIFTDGIAEWFKQLPKWFTTEPGYGVSYSWEWKQPAPNKLNRGIILFMQDRWHHG